MQLNGTKKAPPANIVLPHYIMGAVSFFVLTILMFVSADAFLGHYFSPKLLAITHVAVLGWISMIIFGALYQLLPVVLLSELYSNRIARITFYVFTSGVVLLGFAFWNFSVGFYLQIAALLLLTAVILFAINIYFTAKQAEKLVTEAELILTSVIWLLVTVSIGALMAFNFAFPFLSADHLDYLKLHSHIGFAGWFLLLIMGVSSKLLPMFLLSQSVKTNYLKMAYYFINIALLGFFIDTLFFNSDDRVILYFVVASAGVLLFFAFIFNAYKHRARKQLDIGMKHSILAFAFLLIPVVLGIIVHGRFFGGEATFATITYGSSIIIGFISLLILGQTYKTLPFIVWLNKYGKLAGKEKIPLPKDLYSETLANYQLVFFVLAFPLLLVGIYFSQIRIIQAACVLLMGTATLYLINVCKIIFYSPTIETKK